MQDEEQHTGAQPIPIEGETWAPSVEDDAAQASNTRSTVLYGPNGLRAGWSIALFIVLLLAAFGTLVGLLYSGHLQPHKALKVNGHSLQYPSSTLFSHGILLLCLFAVTWAMSKIESRGIAQYGLNLPSAHRIKQLVIGAGWGVILLSLLVGTLKAMGLLVFDGLAVSGGTAWIYAFKWAGGMLLVGMMEEFLFRGFLLFTLSRGIGSLKANPARRTVAFWIAAIIMSVLFGSVHIGNAGESHFGALSAGLAGLVLCVSLWRTGSLWWGIGWHAGWNWAQSYLYGVGDSATYAYGHLLNSHPAGSALLSGGGVGPEGSLFVLPTLAITAVVMVITLRNEGWPEHQR